MLDISLPRIQVGVSDYGTVPLGVVVSENFCAAQAVLGLFRTIGGEPARVVE